MEDKIAVHCKTKDLWEKVQAKMLKNGSRWYDGGKSKSLWHEEKELTCLTENGLNSKIQYSKREYWEGEGYKIITAAEYLGGKDVKEFSVGDRVECTDDAGYSHLIIGKTYTVADAYRSGSDLLIRVGLKTPRVYARRFKLAGSATKPKTTKENNMNISENILEIFTTSKDAKKVANRFGDQYGDTERDLLALKRDATDLLAIIKDEEDEAKEVKKATKK